MAWRGFKLICTGRAPQELTTAAHSGLQNAPPVVDSDTCLAAAVEAGGMGVGENTVSRFPHAGYAR